MLSGRGIPMSKPTIVASLCALSLGAAAGCATKKFVRTEVDQVNSKVASLTSSLEQVQERVRQAESRITEVDGKAAAATERASAAQQSASAAHQSATSASAAAAKVNARADTIEAAARKLSFEVVLNEQTGNFAFGTTALPAEAKAAIDKLVDRLKEQRSAVWIEIEGHTDNVGDKGYNERLGLTRAEIVKQYLHEQHQIPLHKMNVISFGEERPAADNKTRDGRAQNRRVVIRVLS
jgi:outer membrane protein OmpA-like peptidoglycan-associated protein